MSASCWFLCLKKKAITFACTHLPISVHNDRHFSANGFVTVRPIANEICTRLRQVSRISSEFVKFHSMKLTMMFKLDLKKMTITAFRTPVQYRLKQKVNIFCTENEHLYVFYAPTKNRTNWIRASCLFVSEKKSAITFGEGCIRKVIVTNVMSLWCNVYHFWNNVCLSTRHRDVFRKWPSYAAWKRGMCQMNDRQVDNSCQINDPCKRAGTITLNHALVILLYMALRLISKLHVIFIIVIIIVIIIVMMMMMMMMNQYCITIYQFLPNLSGL